MEGSLDSAAFAETAPGLEAAAVLAPSGAAEALGEGGWPEGSGGIASGGPADSEPVEGVDPMLVADARGAADHSSEPTVD